jgi:integral membrane protein
MTLKILRILAILEGISYLLFAITMPLKYFYGLPQPNFVVGMAHGLLFIAYNVTALICGYQKKWPLLTIFWALLASLIPFGTFVADAKIFKPAQQKSN